MIDPEQIARDFPSLAGRTYLNTAAEGIPPTAVGEALAQYWQDKLLGMDGREAHFRREAQCRETTARHLGLKAQEVSFCSCSAEAYNLLSSALDLCTDDEVVISDLDFPSGATPWFQRRDRPTVRLWKSRNGALDVGDLEPLLGKNTQLVQVSLVSFLNGYRLPWTPFLSRVRCLAPQAIIAVDVTQALGRLDIRDLQADVLISSTHKWSLGVHGGGIVGIPTGKAERLTPRAGGWYHLRDAFAADRFKPTAQKPGAPSFSVGMPSFAPIYALEAGLRYLETIGIAPIVAHTDPLVSQTHHQLRELGVDLLTPWDPACSSGIVAFRHPKAETLHAGLLEAGIHVMHHAGRLRASFHGYNTQDDVDRFISTLHGILKTA